MKPFMYEFPCRIFDRVLFVSHYNDGETWLGYGKWALIFGHGPGGFYVKGLND